MFYVNATNPYNLGGRIRGGRGGTGGIGTGIHWLGRETVPIGLHSAGYLLLGRTSITDEIDVGGSVILRLSTLCDRPSLGQRHRLCRPPIVVTAIGGHRTGDMVL